MQIRSIFSYQYTDVTGQLRRRMRTVFPSGLGGAAAPWLSLWESWHGAAVTERAYAVANMEKAS